MDVGSLVEGVIQRRRDDIGNYVALVDGRKVSLENSRGFSRLDGKKVVLGYRSGDFSYSNKYALADLDNVADTALQQQDLSDVNAIVFYDSQHPKEMVIVERERRREKAIFTVFYQVKKGDRNMGAVAVSREYNINEVKGLAESIDRGVIAIPSEKKQGDILYVPILGLAFGRKGNLNQPINNHVVEQLVDVAARYLNQ